MEMDTGQAVGRKRTAPEVRPEVVAIARLCNLAAEGTLGDAARLMRGASALGIDAQTIAARTRGRVPLVRAICDTLQDTLGDEWRDAVVQAHGSAGDSTLPRPTRQRLDRDTMEATPPLPQGMTAVLRGWQGAEEQEALERLPPELWDAIAARAISGKEGSAFDPTTLLALSQMGTIGRDIIIRRTAPLYVARDPRKPPALEQVPLVEYARLARAFGETDPLRLFLAMAGCVSRAYVEHTLAILPVPDSDDVADRLVRFIATYSTHQRPILWHGLAIASDNQGGTTRELARAVPGMEHYMNPLSRTLATAGYDATLYYISHSLPIGPAYGPFIGSYLDREPDMWTSPFGLLRNPRVTRMTAVSGALSPQVVSHVIFDGAVKPGAIDAWIYGLHFPDIALAKAASAPDAYARTVSLIDALVSRGDAGPVCQRALEHSPYMPRFTDLYHFSPFLVPLPRHNTALLAVTDLGSEPISWALRTLRATSPPAP